MRGLPPLPDDVFKVTVGFDCRGNGASVVLHLWGAGADTITQEAFVAGEGEILFAVLELCNALTNVQTIVSSCRVESGRDRRVDRFVAVSPNHGAWDGDATLQAATAVRWHEPISGRGRQGHNHFPGLPDAFSDDGARINTTGVANVRSAGGEYIAAVAAIDSWLPVSLAACVVHRVRAGVPLDRATVGLVDGAAACPHIGTIRRRIPHNRPIRPV